MKEWNQTQAREITAVARVKKDGLYFYIDQTGMPISDGRYTAAKPFSDGLAAVQAAGKWGYIDKNGTMVIPPRYVRAERFSEGLAAVSENGEEWGFINRIGNLVIPFQKEWIPCGPFSNCLARVKQDGRYGFLNMDGKMAVPARWLEATDFHDCLAWVKAPVRYPWQKDCGCINNRGEMAIPLQYWDFGTDFCGSIAAVPILKYRLIDREGKKYRSLKSRKWDNVHVSRRLSWDRIHVSRWKLSPYLTSGDEDAFEGADDLLHGFIDWDGKLCVPCQWDDVKDYEEGLAAVQKDRQWGYIDKEGWNVISCQWHSCERFSCGLAAVRPFRRWDASGEELPFGWGYIDKSGAYVIEPQFDWAGNFIPVGEEYIW